MMKNNTKAMSLKEKNLLIDRILCEHYGAPFHFFSSKDPLSQMVSAILSHRTKNKVSGKAYRQLRAVLPTWEAVKDAEIKTVIEAIKTVTYPEVKAPRIQFALQHITDYNDGELTLDFIENWSVAVARKWLESIPGVGIKTSAATLNFSHLRWPALVVDTHHLRVAQRLGLIPLKCTLDKGARLLESYLPKDWDGQQVYDNHQGLMRHGQKVCHWKTPNCKICVVREHCHWYANLKKTEPKHLFS